MMTELGCSVYAESTFPLLGRTAVWMERWMLHTAARDLDPKGKAFLGRGYGGGMSLAPSFSKLAKTGLYLQVWSCT